MEEDPHIIRFLIYILMFVTFMCILVTSGSIIQLFIGWEGVGICSYLLINFWFIRLSANKSAIKAILVNRIGDIGFLISTLLILKYTNTLDFTIIQIIIPYYSNVYIIFNNIEFHIITIFAFFFIIAAIGKSAQIGLHTWIPSAMEGPTPVSALIHAATMVTAGIFIIIRTSIFFEFSGIILSIMVIIGSITAFFSAIIAALQTDIKKIIAYSTCSQIGYIMVGCGVSQYTLSLFHIINHAFFKALLFLAAGVLIHIIRDEQDIRQFGGLFFLIPITSFFIGVGSLAISSTPFFSGFYSKDLIIELTFIQHLNITNFSFNFAIVSAILTFVYSNKLMSIFENIFTGYRIFLVYIKELKLTIMVWPLFVLVAGSIFFGFVFKILFINTGVNYFINSIYTIAVNQEQFSLEYLTSVLKLFPIIFLLIPFYLFYEVSYIYNSSIFTKAILKLFFFDKLYNILSNFFLQICYLFFCYFEKIIEYFSTIYLYIKLKNIINYLLKNFSTVLLNNIKFLIFYCLIILFFSWIFNISVKNYYFFDILDNNSLYEIYINYNFMTKFTNYTFLMFFFIFLSFITLLFFFTNLDKKEIIIYIFIIYIFINLLIVYLIMSEFLFINLSIIYIGAILVLFLFIVMILPNYKKTQFIFFNIENNLLFIIFFFFNICILKLVISEFFFYNLYTINNSFVIKYGFENILFTNSEILIVLNSLFNNSYIIFIFLIILLFIGVIVSIEFTFKLL